MNTILVGTDYYGNNISIGDTVITENGESGEIKAVWDNGCVDIHTSNAHQGPVVDSYDIIGHKVQKIFN